MSPKIKIYLELPQNSGPIVTSYYVIISICFRLYFTVYKLKPTDSGCNMSVCCGQLF